MNLRRLAQLLYLTVGLLTSLLCRAEYQGEYVKGVTTGIYSTLKYSNVTGDLVGVELLLLNTKDGLHVVFQSAEGGAASVPIVAKATVVGKQIEFTLPDSAAYPGRFVGTVNRLKIVGQFDGGYLSPTQPGKTFVLPRRDSYWQR